MPRTYKKLTAVQKRANLAVKKAAKLAPPKPPGRPKKIIKPDDAERLAMLGSSDKDIAAGLLISEPTFRARMKDDPEFAAAIERGRASGRIRLREIQWGHAEGEGGPAVNMAIHLGKHLLGQVDKPTDSKHTVDVTIDISSAAERAYAKFEGLQRRFLESKPLPELEVIETVADSVVECVQDGDAGGGSSGVAGGVGDRQGGSGSS